MTMVDMIQRTGKLPFMHRVVEHKGILYFGGMAADDRSGPASEQMAQITSKIDRLLAEHGSDKTRILTATVFLISMQAKSEINPVWVKWLGDELPSRAAVAVADLGDNVLVEVKIIAAAGERAEA